ncbi:hypothetical protein BS50DRAFT_569117 [Corynespora cassiicola Philippines]|uniref:Uncharacterized protein n=1 Tax=Corynespora cassiicola Philippines TaxID=1448308 RepID=A0A2T2P7G7_CORCC|nr:hypothetical protein BS50DRAFT_569117 [Corynespora cassiicola Philippines]
MGHSMFCRRAISTLFISLLDIFPVGCNFPHILTLILEETSPKHPIPVRLFSFLQSLH